mgnify:CR=1 FL=1
MSNTGTADPPPSYINSNGGFTGCNNNGVSGVPVSLNISGYFSSPVPINPKVQLSPPNKKKIAEELTVKSHGPWATTITSFFTKLYYKK